MCHRDHEVQEHARDSAEASSPGEILEPALPSRTRIPMSSPARPLWLSEDTGPFPSSPSVFPAETPTIQKSTCGGTADGNPSQGDGPGARLPGLAGAAPHQ